MILNETVIRSFILDHARSPRNYGKLINSSMFEGNNPGCNDVILIYYKYEKGKLLLSFESSSCTLSTACASILIEEINNKSLKVINSYDEDFLVERLNSNIVYSRPKCTTLALRIIKNIIKEIENDI